jgi:lipoic acid synthetase
MGNVCTRSCRFCAVAKGKPKDITLDEPYNVAMAAKDLGLKYVVVTSVTRDDLPDAGAGVFFDTVREIKKVMPDSKVEILIPDFRGDPESLRKVVSCGADVISHNMETVSRLYPTMRPEADYRGSLGLLKQIKKINNSIITKSGIMVGLGEGRDEIMELFGELRDAECDILTIGQYLAPSDRHADVKRFVSPEEFVELGQIASSLGFKSVSSAPLVRSSFHSQELLEKCMM